MAESGSKVTRYLHIEIHLQQLQNTVLSTNSVAIESGGHDCRELS